MANVQQTGKLEKKIRIRGTIKLLTGLHIGGSGGGLEIGGVDNPILRHPITQEPFIPGSSLKGKLRSLVERLNGKFKWEEKGKGSTNIQVGPYLKPDFVGTLLFGTTPKALKDANVEAQPTSRLIVRDAYLTQESRKWLSNADTDLPYSEIKAETAIDRITAAANPRSLERVPSGAEFEFSCILNVFEGDNVQEYLDLLWTAFELLQDDYLGGSGSRGSGHVSIKILAVEEKTAEDYQQLNEAWRSLPDNSVPRSLRKHPEEQEAESANPASEATA